VCYLHGGDVLPREGIGGVADEQAGFTHSPEMRKEEQRFKPLVGHITVYSSVKSR